MQSSLDHDECRHALTGQRVASTLVVAMSIGIREITQFPLILIKWRQVPQEEINRTCILCHPIFHYRKATSPAVAIWMTFSVQCQLPALALDSRHYCASFELVSHFPVSNFRICRLPVAWNRTRSDHLTQFEWNQFFSAKSFCSVFVGEITKPSILSSHLFCLWLCIRIFLHMCDLRQAVVPHLHTE